VYFDFEGRKRFFLYAEKKNELILLNLLR